MRLWYSPCKMVSTTFSEPLPILRTKLACCWSSAARICCVSLCTNAFFHRFLSNLMLVASISAWHPPGTTGAICLKSPSPKTGLPPNGTLVGEPITLHSSSCAVQMSTTSALGSSSHMIKLASYTQHPKHQRCSHWAACSSAN